MYAEEALFEFLSRIVLKMYLSLLTPSGMTISKKRQNPAKIESNYYFARIGGIAKRADTMYLHKS